jgi:NAD(P)-dependent dehydrogenase (short-subunit alcohol dehydrogenase family)
MSDPHTLLAGKKALITGGNTGIGAAICRAFVASGAQVMINYLHHDEQANSLCDELNAGRETPCAYMYKADISHFDSVVALVSASIDALGGLDIFVNNAGIESQSTLTEMLPETWDTVMNTNLRGAFLCVQQIGKYWIANEQGGTILNITSVHDSVARAGFAHYNVSKAGLSMLTKSIAVEWGAYGIRALSIAPGIIETDINRERIIEFGADKVRGWIPAKRIGLPEDVARACVLMASDYAAYVNGSTILVDGGYAQNLVRHEQR